MDSAILDWKITLVDTVADKAACGVYVLGLRPMPITATDLGLAGMDLRRNGETASVGSGVACLGNPLLAAHWLATTMQAMGEPFRPGDLILSGALGPMVAVRPGDSLRLSIGGLGTVACGTC